MNRVIKGISAITILSISFVFFSLFQLHSRALSASEPVAKGAEDVDGPVGDQCVVCHNAVSLGGEGTVALTCHNDQRSLLCGGCFEAIKNKQVKDHEGKPIKPRCPLCKADGKNFLNADGTIVVKSKNEIVAKRHYEAVSKKALDWIATYWKLHKRKEIDESSSVYGLSETGYKMFIEHMRQVKVLAFLYAKSCLGVSNQLLKQTDVERALLLTTLKSLYATNGTLDIDRKSVAQKYEPFQKAIVGAFDCIVSKRINKNPSLEPEKRTPVTDYLFALKQMCSDIEGLADVLPSGELNNKLVEQMALLCEISMMNIMTFLFPKKFDITKDSEIFERYAYLKGKLCAQANNYHPLKLYFALIESKKALLEFMQKS